MCYQSSQSSWSSGLSLQALRPLGALGPSRPLRAPLALTQHFPMKGGVPTSARRKIEKKTTSQSSAKAPSYTMAMVGISIGLLPVNNGNNLKGNKQRKQHMCQ